jgi:hydrogenase nickel incorporation protein HypB
MCATCGCEGERHDHDHGHGHSHGHATRTLRLEKEVLDRNRAFAEQNRAWLAQRRVTAINLMSAPGSGKTSLLEAVIRSMGPRVPVAVLEGDQETERDASRIRQAGGRAVQINTGKGCHLDAHDVGHALQELDPQPGSVVVIENVGNLVCPALFDLGEKRRLALLSVTEGDDKPLKYPHMFRASEVLVLTKIDLLPHVSFDPGHCIAWAKHVNPSLQVLQLSSRTGEGLAGFCDWLASQAGRAE